MSTAFASVAPKIAKLLPRLASNHDGEVIATVRAIRRTLEGAGTDLHELASVIISDRSKPEPKKAKPRRKPKTTVEADWAEIITRCLRRADELNEREWGFVHSMARYIRAGSAPSEKQAEWLLSIVDNLYGGTKAA